MLKQFINPRSSNLAPRLTAALLLFCCVAVQAGEKDFNQPIVISSDSQEMDLKHNTTIFDINVKVSQGSLSISADYMKVSGQDKKGQEVYLATGKPAIYRQLLDNGEPIIAQADTIRYDVSTRSLTLTGNAQLSQSDSLVKSDIIRYNLITQTLKAQTLSGAQVQSVFNTDSKNDSKNDSQQQDQP